MAKVQGPLLSLEARGKIADAIVFFPWKGRHVVREWLKPANPMSKDQGDQRLMLGALGRGTSPIHTTSAFAVDVRKYMKEGNTWVAEMVQYMLKNILLGKTEWDAEFALYTTLEATAKFTDEAVLLNIQDFDIVYKGATNPAPKGFILYLVAKCVTDWELLGTKGFQRAPYTVALASWAVTDPPLMTAEFVAA